jgi:hypothetical protein
MSLYPEAPAGRLKTGVGSIKLDRAYVKHLILSAAQAAAKSAAAVHAAVTDTGADQVITTGITNPPYPRTISATAGGTAGDIKAVSVIIAGTNINDEAITETLPAFTVNTAGIVTGAKAFKTVTNITIPAHDGLGATTAVGFGDALGLPDKLPANTVLLAALAGVREATAPTVAASLTAFDGNTVLLNSALNATAVDIFYLG